MMGSMTKDLLELLEKIHDESKLMTAEAGRLKHAAKQKALYPKSPSAAKWWLQRKHAYSVSEARFVALNNQLRVALVREMEVGA